MIIILLFLQILTAIYYVTTPQNTTIWQAGRYANISWYYIGQTPSKTTIELFPPNELRDPKLVAVIANSIDGNIQNLVVLVPEEIPAWNYGLRFYDPTSQNSELSYSPKFLILDKNGNGIQDPSKEPNFPIAQSPKVCLDGSQQCSKADGKDPRLNKNHSSNNQATLLSLLSLILYFFI